MQCRRVPSCRGSPCPTTPSRRSAICPSEVLPLSPDALGSLGIRPQIVGQDRKGEDGLLALGLVQAFLSLGDWQHFSRVWVVYVRIGRAQRITDATQPRF